MNEHKDRTRPRPDDGVTAKITAIGRAIVNDPGVQAGLAQIVASLAALVVRAISTRELERADID